MNKYNTYTKGPKAGQPKTLTDRVIRFLTEGLKRFEVPYVRNNKYGGFESTIGSSSYWVGKSGAVRAGTSPSNSISLSAQVKANMELWKRKEREKEKQQSFPERYGKWED